MKLAIITPAGQGGVRDFSDKIMESQTPYARHYVWSRNATSEIESAMHIDCLYLQYSGYGYGKRGAPLWLLLELECNRPKIQKLGIFFTNSMPSVRPGRRRFGFLRCNAILAVAWPSCRTFESPIGKVRHNGYEAMRVISLMRCCRSFPMWERYQFFLPCEFPKW